MTAGIETLSWVPTSVICDHLGESTAMADFRGQVVLRDPSARGHDSGINAVEFM